MDYVLYNLKSNIWVIVYKWSKSTVLKYGIWDHRNLFNDQALGKFILKTNDTINGTWNKTIYEFPTVRTKELKGFK